MEETGPVTICAPPNLYGDEPGSNVQIEVSSPTVKQKTIGSYATYQVQGRDSTGPFSVSRRYKDFMALRTALAQAWPGCVLMQIPPKKLSGNLNPALLETRMKLLDVFLKKCVAKDYIYASEEFQTFIRGPEEYFKLASGFTKPNIIELGKLYQATFTVNSDISDLHQQTLDATKEGLEQAIKTLIEFEEKAVFSEQAFGMHIQSTVEVSTEAAELNAYYKQTLGTPQMKIILKKAYTNPYTLFLDWARAETLMFKGILEAIQAKTLFEKRLEQMESKLVAGKHSLEKLQQGKKSILQMLAGKPVEEQSKTVASNNELLQDEIAYMKYVIRVVTIHLANEEIPRAKGRTTEKYIAMLQTFADTSFREFDEMIAQSRSIDSSFN